MCAVRPGRYSGGDQSILLTARVERSQGGELLALSGDIYRDNHFLTSFIGTDIHDHNTLGMVEGQVRFRGTQFLETGSIRLDVDERGLGTFQLSVDLQGGHRDTFAGDIRWESSRYRRLSVEIDGLEGTLPPSHYVSQSGHSISVQSAYENVGFDVSVHVDPFIWRSPSAIRQRGWTPAEMHRAMEITRRPPIPGSLQTHVFVASFMAGRDNRGVVGIMFDWGNDDLNGRPREGVTIFSDHPLLSDPRFSEETRNREYVYTVIHEIGHALNLLHSFDKARPGALSFMNYSDLFPFGHEAPRTHDGSAEFWRAFNDQFDDQELHHLRHASPREILPGGFSFGRYEEGLSRPLGGDADPRLAAPGANPLRTNRHIELLIQTPKRIYELGEPVFAGIEVVNRGNITSYVAGALDPSEGVVRIDITQPNGQTVVFRPPMRMCRTVTRVPIDPGAKMSGPPSMPLFLSSDGPMFTAPGAYKIRATLSGVDGRDIASSKPWQLIVEQPTSKIERFATALWNNSGAMEALYLRHPLAAPDSWGALEEDIGRADLWDKRTNSTSSIFNYVAGLGWLTPFASIEDNVEKPRNFEKAKERLQRVTGRQLPTSIVNRSRIFVDAEDENELPFSQAPFRFGVLPNRSTEAWRSAIPASGFFGSVGLNNEDQVERYDPNKRIVNSLRGKRKFADIVTWNIQNLHQRSRREDLPEIAEFIRTMRCDFWALQEISEDALERLVDIINSAGSTKYAFFAVRGRGQQNGCLYRTDTTSVREIPLPHGYFDDRIEVRLSNGRTIEKDVFYRKPFLAKVRVRQSSRKSYDFRCVNVHLKSTDWDIEDEGNSMRVAASGAVARWIRDDKRQTNELDYITLGDMNAETAMQGLNGFLDDDDLSLLSVGMQGHYGNDALTRVASGRLLDHIVVSRESVELMPEEDIEEQIIIRSDLPIANFTRDLSDHVPVAVRFILGEDRD